MLTMQGSVVAMKLTFQQWFKLMRSRAGFSQRAIAENLGVTVQTVGNWEGGRAAPSLNPDQTQKLCTMLDVSLDTLARAFRGEIEVED